MYRPGVSSIPTVPAIMGEPSTDSNASFTRKKREGKDIFIFLLRSTALEKLTSDPTDFIFHSLPPFLNSLIKRGQKGRKHRKYCLLKTASDS